MNILLSSAGRRVSLAQAFRTELNARVSDGLLVATDMNPHLSAACHVADRRIAVPAVTDARYIDCLHAICTEQRIGLLVPTIDTELSLLAENRVRFAESGTEVVVSEPDLIRYCRDKRLTADLMVRHGIRTPDIMSRNSLKFPLFAKPYDGSLSKDTFHISNAGELRDHHFANERLIFMEYIDPRDHDEYTVDMYYTPEHRLACAVPRLRMEVRSGEISKGRTTKGPLLGCLAERLAVLEGARGCLTAQFFVHRSTGEAIAIEINPRFGGGFPLSYRAGANYPGWLIDERLGKRARPYWDGWEDKLLMLRYDAEIMVHATGS